MESLEEYILRVSKDNGIILDKEDPICALYTILAKYEQDFTAQQNVIIQHLVNTLRKLYEEHQEKYQVWDEENKKNVEKIMSATFAKSDATLNECLLILKNNSEEYQKKTKNCIKEAINDAIAASVPRICNPLRDPLVKALIGTNTILAAGYIVILFFLL